MAISNERLWQVGQTTAHLAGCSSIHFQYFRRLWQDPHYKGLKSLTMKVGGLFVVSAVIVNGMSHWK